MLVTTMRESLDRQSSVLVIKVAQVKLAENPSAGKTSFNEK